MQRPPIVGSNLTKITVPGNGDCFYSALIIDIIHDVLTGKLGDGSLTAVQIRAVLLPEIIKQLVRRGKPEFNFSGISLKQAIMELLRIVPISELTISQRSDLILKLDDTDTQEIKVIKNCDLYHMLIDVCSTAVRTIMLHGMEEHRHVLQSIVKEVLEGEFSSFIILEHGKALAFEDDAIAAAKNQLSGGELYDADDIFRAPIFDSWNREFLATYSSSAVNYNNKFIKDMFESWWSLNSELAWLMYKKLHSIPGIMAGKPQQIALALVLSCNFKNVNCSNHLFAPLTPELDRGHTFLFCNNLSHVDAMIGNMSGAANKSLVDALYGRMEVFDARNHLVTHEEIMNTAYPWALNVPDSRDTNTLQPSVFLTRNRSAFQSPMVLNPVNIMACAIFGFWRPFNYTQMLAERPPDQHLSVSREPENCQHLRLPAQMGVD